jgi:predicted metal-binding membrane protein
MRADAPASAAPVGRNRALLGAASAATLAGCWWSLWRHSGGVAVHDVLAAHPVAGTAAAYPALVGMWLVMSVAMMLPPVLPWLMLMARTSGEGALLHGVQRAGSSGALGHAAVFAGGYLLLWAAYSAVAAASQLLVQAAVTVDLAARGLDGVAGGAVLVTAGIVQLTTFKAACLAKCRSPIGFFLTHWRPGPRAALAMGVRHGVHCLGCCWALMGVAFAVGVMNVFWMAILTAAIVVEQVAPRGDVLARLFGVSLVVWGTVVMV